MNAIFKLPQLLKVENKKLITELDYYKSKGKLGTRAAKKAYNKYQINQSELLKYWPSGNFSKFDQEKETSVVVRSGPQPRKFVYHHKNPEIKREAVKITRESTEKIKYIELLKEENERLIEALDTYSTWSQKEKHQAKIHYRSYLNVQTLLREFEVNVPEWDTKITLNVNSSSYWDAIEMREKPRGDITRYVRIRNVIGDCCEKCGASEGLEIHHILPKSVAIDDCVHNLQLLCKNCHTEVHWSMQRNPIPYNVKVAMEA